MRKYWFRFLSAIQTEFQYRSNLFLWMVVGAISPIVMTLVWFAVLKTRTEVGGYDQGDFVLYYLMVTISWYVVGGEYARPIGTAIRSGDINKSLLQPYNLVLGKAIWEQAWKLLSLLLSLPAVFFVLYFMRGSINYELALSQIPYIILALLFGALIFGLMQAIIGILAFWMTEIWPVAEMNDMLLQLIGGMLAPLSLMPSYIEQLSRFLPFRYIFYEPVAIILDKTPNPALVIGYQAVFVVILYLVYQGMWRAGIRKYEAVGG